MAGYERALFVAALIAFAGSIVASRSCARKRTRSRRAGRGARSVSALRPRLPAVERRQAIVEAAMRSSRPAATAVRRRPRSPVRPASRSRSSTGISPRSASSTSPASTRRGAASVGCRRRSSPSSATARPVARWRRLARVQRRGQPAEPVDPGADGGRRGPRDQRLPAPAHARGARLHRPTAAPVPRTRAAIPQTATRTRRRGSFSPGACCSRSPTVSAA